MKERDKIYDLSSLRCPSCGEKLEIKGYVIFLEADWAKDNNTEILKSYQDKDTLIVKKIKVK